MNDTTYLIPRALIFVIMVLATIGLCRVVFWCGKLACVVWVVWWQATDADSGIQFKPSDDQEVK